MEPERWREVERIYHLAREQPPDQRATFLNQACGGDDELHREVGSLLKNATGAEEYLQAAVRAAEPSLSSESFHIGPYRVLEEVGRGGMGVVYCAEDPAIGRRVAIKTIQWAGVVNPAMAASLREQFFLEARAAGALSHPHIVTVYHVGEHEGQPYIAMEFIDGQPLTRLIRPVSEDLKHQRWLVGSLGQIASALDYAHSKHIVHRDVKPGNILIGKNKVFKIADFGIAKIRRPADPTTTAFPIGTPAYISPEQLRGQSATPRSDQYSLGVTVFQVLTNKLPFSEDAPGSLIYRIVSEPPPAASSINPKLSRAADSVLEKALSKNPAERFDSCTQFIEALTAALRSWSRRISPSELSRPAPVEPAPAKLPGFISRPPKQTLSEKWLRSRLSLQVTIIVVGLLVLGIIRINNGGLLTGSRSIAEQPTLRLSQVLRAPPISEAPPDALKSGPVLLPAQEADVIGPSNPRFLQRIWAPDLINLHLLGIAADDTLYVTGGSQGFGPKSLWAVRHGTLSWGYSWGAGITGDFWLDANGRVWWHSSGINGLDPSDYGFNSNGEGGRLPPRSKPYSSEPRTERPEQNCHVETDRRFQSLDQECREAVVAPNDDIYVVTLARTLYRLDPTGRVLWTYSSPCDEPFLKVTVPNFVVMGCGNEYLYGIRDGKLRWQFNAESQVKPVSPSALVQDRNGTIFFTVAQQAYAVDIQGKLLWKVGLGNLLRYFGLGSVDVHELEIDKRKRLYLVGLYSTYEKGSSGVVLRLSEQE